MPIATNLRKQHLYDAVWLAGGQATAAIGTLVGVRALTEVLPPQTYGAVSIGLAAVVLMVATASAPLAQAVMQQYPSYAQSGSLGLLRAALRIDARRMLAWVGLLFAIVVFVCLVSARGQLLNVILLAGLLASDARRSLNISVLNAARRHTRYALWTACDAWARPVAALAAILLIGRSEAVVFGAYLLASFSIGTLFSSSLWGGQPREAGTFPATETRELSERLWQFALPLIPVGVMTWSNNLSDRYIIGGMLGLDAAGIYAATFGLSSAPFIMFQTVLEQAFRPVYQSALAASRQAHATRVLVLWLLVTTAGAALGVAAFFSLRHVAAELFLGPLYRSAADLMPWIGAGYALRAVAYVFERVSYAHARTKRVLAGQLCSAAATITITPLAIVLGGLQGAACAVPVCFLIYLGACIGFAAKTLRESPARLQSSAGLRAEAAPS